MSTTWFPRLAVLSLTLGFSLAASPAGAAKPITADATPLRDPANVKGPSLAMGAVVEGNDKLVAGDARGAIASYRRAIKLQPKSPLGHLMLGQALVTTNALAEAESAFKEGESVAETVPAIKARLLFSIADLKERQRKLEDAKAAWLRYGDYVRKHDAGGFPLTATARIAAIDEALQQDKAYEPVRQRINTP
jgi:predicted Zn-dependent protease